MYYYNWGEGGLNRPLATDNPYNLLGGRLIEKETG